MSRLLPRLCLVGLAWLSLNLALGLERAWAGGHDWRELELPGHRLYFAATDSDFALAVSRAIVALTPTIAARYAYDPGDSTIWVLRNHVEWSNGAAYTLLNRIELFSTSSDIELRGFSPWIANVVSHEYGHLATISLANRLPRWLGGLLLGGIEQSGNHPQRSLAGVKVGALLYWPTQHLPRWFSEGIAQFEAERQGADRWDSTRAMLERSAWLADKLLPLKNLDAQISKSSFGGEQVYNQGYSFVRFLAETYGPETLPLLLQHQGQHVGWGFEQSLEAVYGKSLDQLDVQWQQTLAARAQADLDRLGSQPVSGTSYYSDGAYTFGGIYSWGNKHIAFFNDGPADFAKRKLVYAAVNAPSQQTTVAVGVQCAPAWATDNSHLYVIQERTLRLPERETYDLAMINLKTKQHHWLTKGERLMWPAMHPNGHRLMVAKRGQGTWDLAQVDLTSNTVSRLTNLPWGWQIRELSYGPDGRLWASVARENELDIAEILPGSPTRIRYLDWPGSEEQSPHQAPDGSLWFSSDKLGSFQLYAIDSSGNLVKQRSSVAGGALKPIPAVTETIFTLYTHHKYELRRLSNHPDSAWAANTQVADWRELELPQQITAAATNSSTFTKAKFRLSRPLLYPQFQYMYGEPLAGAALLLQDQLGHHSLVFEAMFGRRIDISAEYDYKKLGLSARRFWYNRNLLPFTWNSGDIETTFFADRTWHAGAGFGLDHYRIHDDLELYLTPEQTSGSDDGAFNVLFRQSLSLLGAYMRQPARTLNDIDPRGGVFVLSLTGAHSKSRELAFASSGGIVRLDKRYYYGRTVGDASWAWGKAWFTTELGGRLGWLSRDVDSFDELYIGGTYSSLQRGEFRDYSNLPGYADYAASGEKLAIIKLATRYLLAQDMGSTGQWHFSALVLELAAEAGNTWPYAARFSDIFKSWGSGNIRADGPRPESFVEQTTALDPRFMGLLFDTVADLRLKSSLFGADFNSYFRIAHGLQDGIYDSTNGGFDRPGRLPVRIYLGLGTGW